MTDIELPTFSKWIKVSERLPKVNVPVMVSTSFAMHVGVIESEDDLTFTVTFDPIQGDLVKLHHGRGITHWMPLPELPKE